MNSIEVIIVLLLLFMAVPDLCRKLNRPALGYPVFVLFGLLLGSLLDSSLATMLKQAGQVGFLLLLFEVGLEIDLPRLNEFLRPLRYAVLWTLTLLPLTLLLALYAGLSVPQACLATAALTGCSVGMAHSGWKAFPIFPEITKAFVLHIMVALEMLSIITMAVCGTALHSGVNGWIFVRLAGIALVIMLIGRFAAHLTTLFQQVIAKTTQWRVHWLALLILGVCALGNRLGLDAAKTAFFLGLALSRAKHNGMNLETHIAPVSRRFLIPLFFVSLGLHLQWNMLISLPALLALGAAGLLLGAREILHRRWLPSGSSGPVFLLFCPNLTLVALAANTLFTSAPEASAWLLTTGLLMTVPAILLLPNETGAVEFNNSDKSTSELRILETPRNCAREITVPGLSQTRITTTTNTHEPACGL
ncbi:MAG TPA: cation:proton antiporter [Clostridia bacterium]|nr:cation:proton antiporter [Clostridia bacterium]